MEDIKSKAWEERTVIYSRGAEEVKKVLSKEGRGVYSSWFQSRPLKLDFIVLLSVSSIQERNECMND